MKNKEYVLLQTVASYQEYLILINRHIIPMSVLIKPEELELIPTEFISLYSKAWVSMGIDSRPMFYNLNGNSLETLRKSIKINYIIYNNGEIKKIDRIYKIGNKASKEVMNRKAKLIRSGKDTEKCILSVNNGIWNENDYFCSQKESLSDTAIKTYKKMKD